MFFLEKRKTVYIYTYKKTEKGPYFAAAASRFLAFGAPGSAASAFEANSSLLLTVEVFLRLLIRRSCAALSLYFPANVKPLV